MTLRPFVYEDWHIIAQYQYPCMSEEDIKKMIDQWNKKQFDGRYFEQLTIDADGQIVGYVSLFAQPDGTASEGVEVYSPYRRKGFAFAALKLLIQQAKDLGFAAMVAQIRQDNEASLKLHGKLGFQITNQFINKRGKPVYSLSLAL